MLESIWQRVRSSYTQRQTGLDSGNIEHLRVDLRFRLALVEYTYFGRSGRRVTRCLKELKSVLGDKAVHRYLRALDPELRIQFIERFQNVQRRPDDGAPAARRTRVGTASRHGGAQIEEAAQALSAASNVVPIQRPTGGQPRRHAAARGHPPTARPTTPAVEPAD